jgi:hypothetical protein
MRVMVKVSTLFQRWIDILRLQPNRRGQFIEEGNPLNRSGERFHYQAYVLHVWQEPADAAEHSTTWRYILEDPKTSQRRGFTELSALMDFLEMELHRRDTIVDK